MRVALGTSPKKETTRPNPVRQPAPVCPQPSLQRHGGPRGEGKGDVRMDGKDDNLRFGDLKMGWRIHLSYPSCHSVQFKMLSISSIRGMSATGTSTPVLNSYRTNTPDLRIDVKRRNPSLSIRVSPLIKLCAGCFSEK